MFFFVELFFSSAEVGDSDMEDTNLNKTISVRPPDALRLKLRAMAGELNQSESKLLVMCFEAIDQLAENPHAMPNLVTVVRTLRTSNASFAHPKRPFKPDPFAGNVRLNETPGRKAS